MRKETILAILAGISIGLIFAFGSWKIIKNFRKDIPISTPRPTPAQKLNLFITLDKPNNFDVVVDEEYSFSGSTNPNSNVLIITEENDFLEKTKTDGSFAIPVTLPTGLNQVKLVAFNDQGNSSETKVDLVYSSELIEKEAIAYVGTVTDISGETIQIKDPEGEIKQSSVEDETIYVNGLKKNIVVKSTDLAIGDYIVAMGFMNGNKVLKTKRILITYPMEENKYQAKFITIGNLSKTKINDITLPKKWVGPNIKDLEIGQKIIITGLQNEKKFDIRSIFTVE